MLNTLERGRRDATDLLTDAATYGPTGTQVQAPEPAPVFAPVPVPVGASATSAVRCDSRQTCAPARVATRGPSELNTASRRSRA